MIILQLERTKTHISMTLTFALQIILSGKRRILSLSVTQTEQSDIVLLTWPCKVQTFSIEILKLSAEF